MFFLFSLMNYARTNLDNVCTGNYQEGGKRPPAGTKCVSRCVHKHGYWGASYCYTDEEQKQWGAECVAC